MKQHLNLPDFGIREGDPFKKQLARCVEGGVSKQGFKLSFILLRASLTLYSYVQMSATL